MKRSIFLFISLSISLLLSGILVNAQVNNVSDCNDHHINATLVNTNAALEDAGFQLVYTKMMTSYPKTITTQQIAIEAGKIYQLNFILPADYKNIRISFINQKKEEIFKERLKGKDGLKKVFNKTFTATQSGNYWLVLDISTPNNAPACTGISVLSINQ